MSDAIDPRPWDVETLIDQETLPVAWREIQRRLRRDARLRERLLNIASLGKALSHTDLLALLEDE